MNVRFGWSIVLISALLSVALSADARAQAILLSGWDNANELSPNFTTAPVSGTVGPTVANGAIKLDGLGQGTTPLNGMTGSPSGRWYAKEASGSLPGPNSGLGTDVRLSRSTTIGVVQDPDFPGSTGALKLTQGGSGRGSGGTHFNFAAAGIYLFDNIGTPDFPTRRLVDP
ncbi:MAG TPA: hypothetical protein VGM76_06165 [Lacipirellulaceae bacterium]|jgi:hypothetical protein